MKTKITYIISDINKALAFEWIAQSINSEKYQLSFILLNTGNSVLEEFLLQNNIPVKRIKVSTKKDWPLVWVSLYKILKRQKPEVVHCHLFTANILGLTAAKAAGIKKRIYTRHHSDFHHRYFPKGIKWDKMCNRLATQIVSPSSAVTKVLMEMENVEPDKIVNIPHGFDLTYFRQVTPETRNEISLKYNAEGKYPVIGVISRFTELKGIQYIIPAFQKFLDSYPGSLLIFFGIAGDFKEQIMKMLALLPAESYRLVEFENNLAGVYSMLDIFIQASTDTTIEAFGQTYVEALAAGVPSIFTLSGIAPDFIVDGENALVVPFKDSDAIYKAMMKLAEDKELVEKLKQEGWNSVKNRFALQQMIQKLENLYGE